MPTQRPLTKNDISVLLDEKLKPFLEKQEVHALKLQEHNQTLVGISGDNGLVGDMKEIKETVVKIRGAAWVVGIVGTPTVVGVTHYIIKTFFK